MEKDLYQQLVTKNRYFKDKKPSYVPIPDGFITSAGNPDLAAKYGNNLGTNVITNQVIREAIIRETVKNNIKS